MHISKKNITFAAAKDRMYLVLKIEIGCKGTTKNPNMQIKLRFSLLFAGFCERTFGGMPQGKRSPKYNKKMKNTNYSVKKHQTYWVLFFALLLSGAMNAKVTNYVGAYANAGEWTLLPSGSSYGPSLGVTGGLGFQYELQAGRTYSPARFLFDVGVGGGAGLTSYIQSSSRTEVLKNQYGLSGELFDYVYNVNDRRDKYNDVSVQVPLMVGFQYKRFYMLAGMKIYAHVWTKTKSTATIETYGVDKQFIGDPNNGIFRNMPEYQFFENIHKTGGVKTTLNLDMDLSIEVGGRIGVINYAVGYDVPKRTIEYRLAAFVDYGLMDLHTKGTKEALITPQYYDTNPSSPNYVYKSTSMVDNLVMNDVMSTSGFASKVNNLVIGLKFTVLFQMPEEGKCVICRDSYGTSISGKYRSRGGMKYEE